MQFKVIQCGNSQDVCLHVGLKKDRSFILASSLEKQMIFDRISMSSATCYHENERNSTVSS